MEQIRCMRCMGLIGKEKSCPHCGGDPTVRNNIHQLPAGTLLHGQYLVGRVLGQGGFGITYIGWDNYLNIPVAIKEYYPGGVVMRDCTHSLTVSNVTDSESDAYQRNRDRFLREAKALARLSDVPQVVRVLGYFPENGTAYIVMEYIQGQTLKELVQRNGPVPAAQLMQMLEPVMVGLQKVHEAGLIHRDISPDNIMVLPDGRIKLLDFGAVRDYEKNADLSTEAILKHGFAPLEQYQRRGKLGPWSDVYALCGTVFFCLTGKTPPDAPERMLYGETVDWQTVPGLMEHQRLTLEKGMAMLVDQRIQDIAGLRSGLAGQLRETDHTPDPKPEPVQKTQRQPEPQSAPKPAKQKKRVRKLPILLTVLAVAVTVAVVGGSVEPLSTESAPQTMETENTEPPTTPPETTPPETTETETAETESVETEFRQMTVSRNEDGKTLSFDSEDFTITVTNRDVLQATLRAPNLMESYYVDLNKADGNIKYLWGVYLCSGDNQVGFEVRYQPSLKNGWAGQVKMANMDSGMILGDRDGGCLVDDVVTEWGEKEIRWLADVGRHLQRPPIWNIENGMFDFDFEAVTHAMVWLVNADTGLDEHRFYYVME